MKDEDYCGGYGAGAPSTEVRVCLVFVTKLAVLARRFASRSASPPIVAVLEQLSDGGYDDLLEPAMREAKSRTRSEAEVGGSYVSTRYIAFAVALLRLSFTPRPISPLPALLHSNVYLTVGGDGLVGSLEWMPARHGGGDVKHSGLHTCSGVGSAKA